MASTTQPAETSHGMAVALTPAEVRFDRRRRTVGLFGGVAGAAIVWALPLGLPFEAHRLAAVVTLVVIWWITEALPFAATALFGTALAVLAGVASAEAAFAPFASPNIFLFIGCFIIVRAASYHQLDRRIAAAIVARRWAQRSLSGVRSSMVLLTLIVSAWMSNAATVALMLPIATGLLPGLLTACGTAARPYTIGFLLSIAYAAGIGGMITPIGSPPNLITIGLLERVAGIHLDFFTWMGLMIPIAAAHVALLLAAARWRFPSPQAADGTVLLAVGIGPDLTGRWTPGQRNCAFVCVLIAALWLVPGLVAVLAGPDAPIAHLLNERLNEGASAVFAAGLLFVLPTSWRERKFTLTWQEAARIDWGTILLLGGGLALGQLMFSTGLAEHLGRGLLRVSGATQLWTVTAVAIATGMIFTEVTSNTASTSMLVPVVLAMCTAGGIEPVPPALGAMLGASSAYVLPISAPHNAIIYGTGMIPVTEMMRFGLLVKIGAFFLIWSGLRVLCPILGLA